MEGMHLREREMRDEIVGGEMIRVTDAYGVSVMGSLEVEIG